MMPVGTQKMHLMVMLIFFKRQNTTFCNSIDKIKVRHFRRKPSAAEKMIFVMRL
jgi:hypothetical protein